MGPSKYRVQSDGGVGAGSAGRSRAAATRADNSQCSASTLGELAQQQIRGSAPFLNLLLNAAHLHLRSSVRHDCEKSKIQIQNWLKSSN